MYGELATLSKPLIALNKRFSLGHNWESFLPAMISPEARFVVIEGGSLPLVRTSTTYISPGSCMRLEKA